MKETKVEEFDTDLVKAIESRGRPTHLFDVANFIGLTGDKRHVMIRVATKGEEDRAVVQGNAYVKKLASDSGADRDDDLLVGAKTCFVLHTCLREVTGKWGAFPAPEWMIDKLTTDQIATLLNLYNEVRKKEGPQPTTLDDESIEGMMRLLVEAADAEEAIPQWLLAAWSRETLSEAMASVAVKLDVARRDADAALAIAGEQRNRITLLESALKDAGIELPVMPAEPSGTTS